jgi:ABC-type multidrug transport system fused ATPase/permease subunit
VRRYLGVWLNLFRLSWRTQRGLTVASFCAISLSVISVAAGALALRLVVNSIASRDLPAAAGAAVVTAIAYAIDIALEDSISMLGITTADRVGRLEVHPDIHRSLASLPGIEHLERSDFLDRVTVVRVGTGKLVQSSWNALIALAGALKLVVVLLLLGTVSPWLLFLLPLAAVPVWCDRRGQEVVRRVEMETAEAYRLQEHLAAVTTSPEAAKEIRVAGSGSWLTARQADAWRQAMGPRAKAQMIGACYRLAGWTAFTAGFIGALMLIIYNASHGHGRVGDVVLAVAVAASLRQAIQGTVASTSSVSSAARFIDPYLWFRRYVAEQSLLDDGVVAPAPDSLRQGITISELSYTYPGTDHRALDRVSVHIPPGSVVAIVGEYGSGKTTLVKLLCKLYRPDSGSISVEGTELSSICTDSWRTRLSAVFQDFGRFHTVLAESIGLGQVARIGDRHLIEQAVRDAGAEKFVAALPDGLDTQLGPEFDGVDLSEGQWQRTALARASMRPEPVLFILDEPTASLDAISEQEIFERYMAHARTRARHSGAITVVVTHRLSTVTGADLILVLEDGRLTETGSHAELMNLNGRYADVYTLQAKAYARG